MDISSPGVVFSSTTPLTVDPATAADSGSTLQAARGDHRHAEIVGGIVVRNIMTANQTFTSNTTLASLTNLSMSVAANKHYYIHVRILCDGSGGTMSGGWKIDVTGPAAPTRVGVSVIGCDAGDFYGGAETAFSTSIGATPITSTAVKTLDLYIVLDNGANAGTVQVRAAQNVSNAQGSRFLAGSSIIGWQVA